MDAFIECNRQAKLKKKVLNNLLKTRIGSVLRVMDIWKRLPTKSEQKKRDATSNVEGIFVKLQNRRLKAGFEALKDVWYEIRNIKIKYLRHLIYVTTDKKKRMFTAWANNAKAIRYVEASRSVIHAFETISEGF